MDKEFVCELCGKEFNNRKSYWYHTKKTKVLCISKEEFVKTIQSKDSRINYFKAKEKEAIEELEKRGQELEKLKKEMEYLKTLLQKRN